MKDSKEDAEEDVDLFAGADDRDGQGEEELEDEVTSAGTSSPSATANVFSVFGTAQRDRDDDDNTDGLFFPAGAQEGGKFTVELEDNSQLLK